MSNTLWTPRLPRNAAPIYRAVADALERDIADGVLRDGTRLPTHRELAGTLGVTPLTVTRAYREAARRGLIESTVGRGTFVRTLATTSASDTSRGENAFLDLSRNIITGGEDLALEPRDLGSIRAFASDPEYHPTEGTFRHRSAGAAWMKRARVETTPERIVITPGAQQAVVATLAAICRPGDTVLVEELTYPRLASMAALLDLKLQPIRCDDDGADAKSLEKQIKATRAKAVYLIPNFQNPTGSVMPERRRREIAAVIGRARIPVIEDDVYGFLLSDPLEPLANLIPELGVYVTSVSKSLSPSFRLGFASLPESLVDRVNSTFSALTAFTSTIPAEIFTLLFERGDTDRVIQAKRDTIGRHRRIADRALAGMEYSGHESSPHLWLTLPASCDALQLADRTRQRGIGIAPASAVGFDRRVFPNAVRVSLGATPDAKLLERALRTVACLGQDTRLSTASTVA
jgi:DNA-binding transcriptional MocR family regulator